MNAFRHATAEVVIRHGHMACGLGAGAAGMNAANPRVGPLRGRFECAGGIDVDEGAIRNFERLTGVMDLFSEAQYRAFHQRAPDPSWREATPLEIRRVFGRLDVLFASYPCKGFSGLLSARTAETAKYQALNDLTTRGMMLSLEAYRDDPVAIVAFENVPRIATARGARFLAQIDALYRAYGYVVSDVEDSIHDCGAIGGLAQRRKRFLRLFRHPSKVPNFIYQPAKKRLRGVGEVIGKLRMPGDPAAGVMHRVPALQWKTWVRLAFVPGGRDWRALNDLAVIDGRLRDFGIVPEQALRENALGVLDWSDTAPTLTSALRRGRRGAHRQNRVRLAAGLGAGRVSWREPDLFYGDKQPPRTLPPMKSYRPAVRKAAKPFAWESMGAWLRLMHRLFALEAPSSEHYWRTRETARALTVERIRDCRHDDDLARCEAMLVEARAGWLYGLDRAFTRAERGTLLVEVRNRRQLLALGREAPKPKGARMEARCLPDDALERLIQSHADAGLVDRLRGERERRAVERRG